PPRVPTAGPAGQDRLSPPPRVPTAGSTGQDRLSAPALPCGRVLGRTAPVARAPPGGRLPRRSAATRRPVHRTGGDPRRHGGAVPAPGRRRAAGGPALLAAAQAAGPDPRAAGRAQRPQRPAEFPAAVLARRHRLRRLRTARRDPHRGRARQRLRRPRRRGRLLRRAPALPLRRPPRLHRTPRPLIRPAPDPLTGKASGSAADVRPRTWWATAGARPSRVAVS